MRDSEILWAARGNVARGWCKKRALDDVGNVCVVRAIGDVIRGDQFDIPLSVRLLDHLRDTLDGTSPLTFNDDPDTTQRDVLDLLEKTAIRLEEHGKEVVVLEKRVDTGTKVTGYVMMAGTPERLVRQLEENNDAGWSSLRTFPLVGNRGSPLLLSFIPDGNFPYDFLMTFRIFMTAQEVLTIFRTRYAPSSVFFFLIHG